MKPSDRYYAEERPMIDVFREKYEFLSNFFPAKITFEGLHFQNAEAAYQAAKCANPGEKKMFINLYGNQAKKLGRQVSCREDWDEIKIPVMRKVLYAKFTQNALLAKYLLETGEKPLLEGNFHGDLFWGIDGKTREGENHLGRLLMELREEFSKNGVPDHSEERQVQTYGPVSNILLTEENITLLDVECIVNAANKTLLGGGGVDGAIHREAGPELLEECKTLNGCETGEAKITGGYHLKAKHIIHTVGPVYGKEDEKLLEVCYKNCLALAREHHLHSVAFPAISTGKFCYPKQKAAYVAVHTVLDWMEENSDYPMEIIFSCPDQRNFDIMKVQLENINGC